MVKKVKNKRIDKHLKVIDLARRLAILVGQ